MIDWLLQRWQASRVAAADADMLIFNFGQGARAEASRRERAILLRRGAPVGRSAAHWRRVASLIRKRARH